MRTQLAFSLIEALVASTVVVILGWILIPVLSEVRSSSRNSQDLDRLRRLSTGLLMYADAHDDRYVPAGFAPGDGSWSPARDPEKNADGRPWNGWALKLRTYSQGDDAFAASQATSKLRFQGACAHANGMAATSTQAYNWFLGADGSQPALASTPEGKALDRPIRQSEVVEPSNTISFHLSPVFAAKGADSPCLRLTLQAPDVSNSIRFPSIHRGGGNLAFTDGHTRFFEARQADPDAPDAETIYHWRSRGIWMVPSMPESRQGFENSGGIQ